MSNSRGGRTPRQFLMMMMVAGLLAMISGTVQAQNVRPGSFSNMAGPPTEAAAREQKIRDVIGNTGLPATVSAGSLTGGAADALSLPDLTQTVPTTTEPKKLSNSLQILLLLSVLTLAPSILLMTTCFTRIVIVMSLLRQALGAAQLPPNQVLIGLSLFMTFLVMGPSWNRIHTEAITPYSNSEISQFEAFDRAKGIMRVFMIKQIEAAHNEDDVYLFHSYSNTQGGKAQPPQTWEEVSTTTLVPAFILSELKVAFLMGFRIYLPFLIIDMVISSVLISIGMQLLPPVMVSLPFKLLLFVLVDGWHLVVATLLASFN